MNRIPLLALTLALSPACSGGDKDGDDGDGNDGFTDDSGQDGGSTDGQSPTIESADSWCYLHETGDQAYFWVAEATVTDPQGADTLDRFYDGGILIYAGGVQAADSALVCDENGQCFGSWNENEDGIACANATAYTIGITAMDEDGNLSAEFQVTGRQGNDASGR